MGVVDVPGWRPGDGMTPQWSKYRPEPRVATIYFSLGRPVFLGCLSTPEAPMQFESLLCELSSRFINVAPEEVDREIEEAQGRICESLDVDLSALWRHRGLRTATSR